jgi:hypothetical protein
MAAHRLRPENLEERLIWWAMVLAWPLWAVGLLLLAYSMLGWVLALLVVGRRLGWLPVTHNHVERPVPVMASTWLAGMAMMLVVLIIAHVDFELGSEKTLKSSIGWAKGWGLIGATVFAGAMTHIRPALLIRASCVLGLHTLIMTPLMVLAALVDLPTVFYVSPLQILGPDETYYAIGLHSRDGGTLGFRLSYFAPWAPAAAFFGVVSFVLALFEKNAMWRAIGLVSALLVCVLTQSRLAVVALPLIGGLLFVTARITRPWLLAAMAVSVVTGLLFADPLIELYRDVEAVFTGARADSSRVRSTLQRMALHRWESDGFWFGNAVVEKGPHLVEYMMIGSHHNWFGLLFVKGLVGFLACLLPFLWTTMELFARAIRDRIARACLGTTLALLLFSFGENLEMLAYLIWPAFLLIGIVAKRRISFPPEERAAPQAFRDLMAQAVH